LLPPRPRRLLTFEGALFFSFLFLAFPEIYGLAPSLRPLISVSPLECVHSDPPLSIPLSHALPGTLPPQTSHPRNRPNSNSMPGLWELVFRPPGFFVTLRYIPVNSLLAGSFLLRASSRVNCPLQGWHVSSPHSLCTFLLIVSYVASKQSFFPTLLLKYPNGRRSRPRKEGCSKALPQAL